MLALICMVSGRLDDAAIHFQKSYEFCTDSAYGPESAQTCHDYGSLLMARGEHGDREKAISMVDQGLWLTEELAPSDLKGSFRDQRAQAEQFATR
jgi:hypothetical protein